MENTDQGIAEAVRYLMNKDELVRAPKREALPTPIISGGTSRPAYLTVDDGGYDTLGSHGDLILWGRVVSDPDHLLNWDIATADEVYFTAPGLYLIDYQLYIDWPTLDAPGHEQWEILSNLWNTAVGIPYRPWMADLMWTTYTTEFGTITLNVAGSHLVEVTNIANDFYYLFWDLWDEEPVGHMDLDNGHVFGFNGDWNWTWLKVVRLNSY